MMFVHITCDSTCCSHAVYNLEYLLVFLHTAHCSLPSIYILRKQFMILVKISLLLFALCGSLSWLSIHCYIFGLFALA